MTAALIAAGCVLAAAAAVSSPPVTALWAPALVLIVSGRER